MCFLYIDNINYLTKDITCLYNIMLNIILILYRYVILHTGPINTAKVKRIEAKNDTINLVFWKRMTTAGRDAFSKPTRATSSSHSLWNLNTTEITTCFHFLNIHKYCTFSKTHHGFRKTFLGLRQRVNVWPVFFSSLQLLILSRLLELS